MSLTLSERVKNYENSTDFKLLSRLPIFIRLSLRSFNRVSKKIEKPYDKNFSDLLSKTLLSTISEIDNSVLGFYYYDTFNIVIKNDPLKDDSNWLGNSIQKITSVTSSLMTYNFYKLFNELDNKLEITGPVIFDCSVFPLPSIDEVFNSLIDSQSSCIVNCINLLSYDFYSKKYGKNEASSFLEKKNTSDRILLLKDDFNFDINTECDSEFLYGIVLYKVPYIYTSSTGSIRKNKWIIDKKTSKFKDDKNSILNILHSGYDVFRIGRDIS